MSKYKITTIKELMDVVSDDNVELLKHDIGEFLDYVLAARYLDPIITVQDCFIWNDDGEKGVKLVHFTNTDGEVVATIPMPKEDN